MHQFTKAKGNNLLYTVQISGSRVARTCYVRLECFGNKVYMFQIWYLKRIMIQANVSLEPDYLQNDSQSVDSL